MWHWKLQKMQLSITGTNYLSNYIKTEINFKLQYKHCIHSKIATELYSQWSFIIIKWIRAAVTFRSTGKSHTSDIRETWVRLDNDRMSGVQENSLFLCQEKSPTVFHICPHDTSYSIHFHFSEKSIFRLPQHPRMQWEIKSSLFVYHIQSVHFCGIACDMITIERK